jgi:hypothetical protein
LESQARGGPSPTFVQGLAGLAKLMDRGGITAPGQQRGTRKQAPMSTCTPSSHTDLAVSRGPSGRRISNASIRQPADTRKPALNDSRERDQPRRSFDGGSAAGRMQPWMRLQRFVGGRGVRSEFSSVFECGVGTLGPQEPFCSSCWASQQSKLLPGTRGPWLAPGRPVLEEIPLGAGTGSPAQFG